MHRMNDSSRIKQYIETLKIPPKRGFIRAFDIALLYAELGDEKKVFEWLETAYTLRDRMLPQVIKVTPFLDNYRNDSRYKAILSKLNQLNN